jgi:hypothetical protein
LSFFKKGSGGVGNGINAGTLSYLAIPGAFPAENFSGTVFSDIRGKTQGVSGTVYGK